MGLPSILQRVVNAGDRLWKREPVHGVGKLPADGDQRHEIGVETLPDKFRIFLFHSGGIYLIKGDKNNKDKMLLGLIR